MIYAQGSGDKFGWLTARENGDVDWLKMENLTEAQNEMIEFFYSIDTIFTDAKLTRKV